MAQVALFFGNILAGVHAVLIIYFLIGWLIPFAPLWKRAGFNVILAGSFLFFRMFGWCPLTLWESGLRALADPGKEYGASYIARNAALVGFDISPSLLDTVTLFSTILIFCIALLFAIKGRMRSVPIKSYTYNG